MPRLFCALTGSCYYLPPEIVPVHPETPPGKFFGITELTPAPDSNRIRILFVHGIGVHPGCDPDTLLLHLTKPLQVVQLPPPAVDPSETCALFVLPMPTPIPAPNAQNSGLLYRFDLAGRDRQVTFMYLRWSTLTSGPKMTLDEPNRPPGALLHNLAKQFEQDNLADVVLYGVNIGMFYGPSWSALYACSSAVPQTRPTHGLALRRGQYPDGHHHAQPRRLYADGCYE